MAVITKKLYEAEDFVAELTNVCFAMFDGLQSGDVDLLDLSGAVCDAAEKRGLNRVATAQQFSEGIQEIKTLRDKHSPRPIATNKPASNVGMYEARDEGFYQWRSTMNGLTDVHLTNFTAQIISDVVEDDGQDIKRFFELEARQAKRKAQFLVAADEFGSMKWATANLGAKAVIFPRQADYARCAIQILSPLPKERRIFTHTGWREIDDEMRYLHGGGAIGRQDVKQVEVRLPDSLAHVVLPEPPTGEDMTEAISTVLDLIGLAADEITLPAIGAAWSSVIGGADFSIWLWGGTGAGKSQLAALIQSFFGNFNADKLPGSWLLTANALEAFAHAAKDMIFVVDDFKPTGSAQDRAKLHRDADRLLRAQGNQHGRQRLASDTTQRKTKHPRGLIFNTAEEVPQGESLVARLFILECRKTSIDFSQLTKQQIRAANGFFASSMSGFIRWLAAHHDKAIKNAPREIAHWRDYWAQRQIAHHRRCAPTLGHLTYAWELWIQFAQEAGALTSSEAEALRQRVLLALGKAGSNQDSHANSQNPVTRFLELLQAAFASNKAHLEHVNGEAPADATNWGWRRFGQDLQPCGEKIGWHTGEEIYLLPDSAFSLLERFAASGEGLGVQQTTLWKHLHEKGLLTARDEKRRAYTIRRKVQGIYKNVLVLAAQTLSSYHENADIADIGAN